VRLRIIPELGNESMAVEGRLNDAALNAPSSPVDEPDLPQAASVRRLEVLVDDGRDVTRRERVQVDLGFD